MKIFKGSLTRVLSVAGCVALWGLMLWGLVPGAAHAERLADVFEAHNPASDVRVDYGLWQSFLDAYVVPGKDGITRVCYACVTPQGRQGLQSFLEKTSAMDPADFSRDEQFAWWVNLYNAATVERVLEHYPIKSIKDIDRFKASSRGPWNDVVIKVKGHGLGLDDIEHEILRPLWQDPRIHYVVNCASLGCPNLGALAFSSARPADTLDSAARAYINHPRGVAVKKGRLHLSKIYKWYQGDFGANEDEVLQHIKAHADKDLREALEGVTKVSRYHYDWSLNEAEEMQSPQM